MGKVTCTKVTRLESSCSFVTYSTVSSHAYILLYLQIGVFSRNLFLCVG